MSDEPIAWIKRSDVDRCQTSECVVDAYSVQQMHADHDESVPLYSPDQVEALLADLRSTVSVLEGRLKMVTKERDGYEKALREIKHQLMNYPGIDVHVFYLLLGIVDNALEAMQTGQQDGEEA